MGKKVSRIFGSLINSPFLFTSEDEYKIVITKNAIVLEKVTKPEVDIDGFLEEIEELEPDPNQPSLEEISEVVKEVRLTIKSGCIPILQKPKNLPLFGNG